jgi:glucose dehydrogenase
MWDKAGGYQQGAYTPFMYHVDGAPPRSTIQFPGGIGGVNWGGPAADPTTGWVYVNAHDTSLVGWVEKKDPKIQYSFEAPAQRPAVRSRQCRRQGAVLRLRRADQRQI